MAAPGSTLPEQSLDLGETLDGMRHQRTDHLAAASGLARGKRRRAPIVGATKMKCHGQGGLVDSKATTNPTSWTLTGRTFGGLRRYRPPSTKALPSGSRSPLRPKPNALSNAAECCSHGAGNAQQSKGQNSCPSLCPYSPECVEGAFCERRLDSVLGVRMSPGQPP
jgi:hypothetical protein